MTTLATPAATAAPTGRISRDQLVRLGQSGAAWQFLPIAVQLLGPGGPAETDAGLQLLAASSFARLGLHTPAREHLDRLPDVVRADPGVARLADALPAALVDVIPTARLVDRCERNVRALAARGIDVRDALDAWRERVAGEQWLRARDGNIVRRRGVAWIRLRDEVGEAAQLKLPHRPGARAGDADASRPLTLEGVDPPWLLRRMFDATPPGPDGYQPTIAVLQRDPMALLDGLALLEDEAPLTAERVRWFVGEGAGDGYSAWLRSRSSYLINGPIVVNPSTRAVCEPAVNARLREALEEQSREVDETRARVEAMYAGRGSAWWSRRFEEAASGAGEPLRVLIPTCRYSTYIQHASRDLAEQLRAMGCEAEVLIEPDAGAKFTSLAYLRAIESLRPDLVVLINYTRAHVRASIPPGVPFVCWIQDAMPHLFDRAAGAGQGELDFLVGNVFPSLHEHFGYPRARTLRSPVSASGRKFHPAPVAPSLRSQHECEAAYISHHGAPPEELLEEHVRSFAGNAPAQGALRALMPRLTAFVEDVMSAPIHATITRLTREAFEEAAGRTIDEALLTLLVNQCALPLADRIIRHHTIGWAAEIAERRGWRLRLCGAGWSKNERFAKHACPEVPHGEELRAAYQAAACHLHMTINAIPHQRVFECAMSGGLPLCRLHFDELLAASAWAERRAFETGEASYCMIANRALAYRTAEHPALLWLARQRQLLGLPAAVAAWRTERRDETLRSARPEEQLLLRLLGDASETVFTTKEELEARMERAIERPRWRENTSAMIARRVRSGAALDAFARSVVDLVRTSLAEQAKGATE